jgi:Ig-like domain-containing protein
MLVRNFTRPSLFTLLAAALTLAACNVGSTPAPTVDINAINTAANATAMAQIAAQLTQTALAAPSNTPLPTDTPLSLATSALPTTGGPTPTGGVAGALPTLSFNNTPNTTPLAGFTPLATSIAPTSGGVGSTASGCNDALFVGETLPDKSVLKPGKDFSKAWQLQNSGTCNWDEGYVFTFRPELSSSEIKGYDVAINNSDEVTKPNHSQTFVVKLTAPSAAGEYKGYWQMKTDSGSFFGPIVFLDIVVK